MRNAIILLFMLFAMNARASNWSVTITECENGVVCFMSNDSDDTLTIKSIEFSTQGFREEETEIGNFVFHRDALSPMRKPGVLHDGNKEPVFGGASVIDSIACMPSTVYSKPIILKKHETIAVELQQRIVRPVTITITVSGELTNNNTGE